MQCFGSKRTISNQNLTGNFCSGLQLQSQRYIDLIRFISHATIQMPYVQCYAVVLNHFFLNCLWF